MTEAEFRQQCASVLGLTGRQTDEFMADFWDWYCGELDTELAGYAARLRPRFRTGILSNSLAGARPREQARYGFEQLVDVVVYSDEAGLAKPDPRAYELLCAELQVEPAELVFLDNREPNVSAAAGLGIHAILHRDAASSIAALDAVLPQSGFPQSGFPQSGLPPAGLPPPG
jgi:putative hydrolase of the HAD superfamily